MSPKITPMDDDLWNNELREHVTELGEVLKVLMGDSNNLFRLAREEKSDAHRRAFIRATCSMIEGVIFQLKSLCKFMQESQPILTEAELQILSEVNYELADNGTVNAKPLYLKLKPNFLFTFRTLAKFSSGHYQPSLSGEGWRSLLATFRVRDSLTHPKLSSGLKVSDSEFEDARRAYIWFQGVFGFSILCVNLNISRNAELDVVLKSDRLLRKIFEDYPSLFKHETQLLNEFNKDEWPQDNS